MKNKKLSFLLTLCAAMVSFSLSGCGEKQATNNNNGGGTIVKPLIELSEDVVEYYKPLENNNHKGREFLEDLRAFNAKKRKRVVGYEGMKSKFSMTDCNKEGTKIVSFYSNTLVGPAWDAGATWNREHVWPDSRGGGPKSNLRTNDYIQEDMHMPRPAKATENSGRGNRFFSSNTKLAYDPGCYGIYTYRGIASRIIFYCALVDPLLEVLPIDDINCHENNHAMGNLVDMMRWNTSYLPSTSSSALLELWVEQNRNNKIQELQGNRNPFIDHPEYIPRIWAYMN